MYRKRILERHIDLAGLNIRQSDILWVVTVPAIWGFGGKQIIRDAAKIAGLWNENRSQLVIALEPEVAALYIMDEYTQHAEEIFEFKSGYVHINICRKFM